MRGSWNLKISWTPASNVRSVHGKPETRASAATPTIRCGGRRFKMWFFAAKVDFAELSFKVGFQDESLQNLVDAVNVPREPLAKEHSG